MSQFHQMHADEVREVVELKTCENCSGNFFRKDKVETLCLGCKHKPYMRQQKRQYPSEAYWITSLRKWRRGMNG